MPDQNNLTSNSQNSSSGQTPSVPTSDTGQVSGYQTTPIVGSTAVSPTVSAPPTQTPAFPDVSNTSDTLAPPPKPDTGPSDYFPPASSTPPPKKTFGTNKIIATFLGIFLLVGGVLAGIMLIRQPQIFQQQAVEYPDPRPIQLCPTNGVVCSGNPLQGVSSCQQPDGDVWYCCGAGEYISGDRCVPDIPTCERDLECSTVEMNGSHECLNATLRQPVFCCPAGLHAQGGSCVPDVTEQCGTGLDCANNFLSGSVACRNPSSTGNPVLYCCPSGYGIFDGSGVCLPNNNCDGDNDCAPGRLCRDNFCISPESIIQCGISQCQAQDCHCKNGDVCDTWQCEGDVRTSCLNQLRSWCTNYQGNAMTCCANGYVCNPTGYGCVPSGGPTSPPGGTPPPTNPPGPTPTPGTTPTPGPTAVCSGVKAYSTEFVELTNTDLSALSVDDTVNFCVAGTSDSGTFDMARFTINGALQSDTTTKRPGTNDYCQDYTIPAGVNTFTVTAEIHHVVAGWVGP